MPFRRTRNSPCVLNILHLMAGGFYLRARATTCGTLLEKCGKRKARQKSVMVVSLEMPGGNHRNPTYRHLFHGFTSVTASPRRSRQARRGSPRELQQLRAQRKTTPCELGTGAVNATKATTHWQLAQTLANNGAALARLQAQGVKTLQFPDDVWDAFGAASKTVMDENMGDELFARTRASFEESLASSASWIQKSDGYYVEQRTRVLGG